MSEVLNRSDINKLKAYLASEEFDLSCLPPAAPTGSFTQSPSFLARWKEVWERVSQGLDEKSTLTFEDWNTLCTSSMAAGGDADRDPEIEAHLRKLVDFFAEPLFTCIASDASRQRQR